MIYIMIMLYGRERARNFFLAVLCTSLLGFLIGAYYFLLPFYTNPNQHTVILCIPILLESIRSFFCAFYSQGATRSLRISRGLILLLMIYIIIFAEIHPWNAILSGFITGSYLMFSSIWKMSNSFILRFKSWEKIFIISAVEFCIGIWNFIPWSFDYSSRQIYWDVGTLIIIYSFNLSVVYYFVINSETKEEKAERLKENKIDKEAIRRVGTVHVWTTTGKLPLFYNIVERYIISRNASGVISTGHVSFELDDIYISHYPENDIDRDTTQFMRILKSTDENDAPGIFQPNYEYEVGISSPSVFKIAIDGVSKEKLDIFWSEYRKNTTYNLTNRNCSTVVSLAITKSTEGYFYEKKGGLALFLKLLFSPELWVMAQLRKHAAIMTWTPGIVLDYSRAMSFVLKL